MGSYESLFQVSEDQAGRNLEISNADWLTGHAGFKILHIICLNLC